MNPAQYEILNSVLLDALDRIAAYHAWWAHESQTAHEREMQRIAREERKNYDVIRDSFIVLNEERAK